MNTELIYFCEKCLYPSNHPLLISFDKKGVCMGCKIHEEKNCIDWDEKFIALQELTNTYRTDAHYDCIVPVTGGKDSFFILHIVKNVLKLNPLLIAYNRCYNTPIGIQNLENLRTRFGCDIITMTPRIESVKKMITATLELIGSMHWPYLAGASVFPVQMAVKLKVPLIIWGAHQGLDQVGMFSHHDEVEMTRRYRREHDLLGYEAEDLVNKHPSLTEEMLSSYFYPIDSQLEKTGVRGIYLNNYIRWDSKAQHEKMINLYGYLTTEQYRSFDTYNDVHCAHYSGVHDYIKYCKFGFGKALDHACREIRLGRLDKKSALRLVKQYQNNTPKDLEKFLVWIGWTEKDLQSCIDKFRDPKVWQRLPDGTWKHRYSHFTESANSEQQYNCQSIFEEPFIVNSSLDQNKLNELQYPLLLRGWSKDLIVSQEEIENAWFPTDFRQNVYA